MCTRREDHQQSSRSFVILTTFYFFFCFFSLLFFVSISYILFYFIFILDGVLLSATGCVNVGTLSRHKQLYRNRLARPTFLAIPLFR
ncbi:Uncharacterized protein APZ42_034360 [Daphnia magna]|uniref:Uncharacterized protein n=1 Tax=Daphnia magna TaxID=35525 RepID=A0A164K3X5_9CRUS|nr:Uncharacterized protein APZ42_034360 [Daphnia magna]